MSLNQEICKMNDVQLVEIENAVKRQRLAIDTNPEKDLGVSADKVDLDNGLSLSSYSSENHDSIILALGEELEALFREHTRLDRLFSDLVDDERLTVGRRQRQIIDNMHNICLALSAFKAQSYEAVAVQIRALYNNVTLCDDGAEKRTAELVDSFLSFIEAQGGFTRDRWAGEYFLPRRP